MHTGIYLLLICFSSKSIAASLMDFLSWLHWFPAHTHDSFSVTQKGFSKKYIFISSFSGLMVNGTWRVTILLVIWSLTFPTNSVDELICCSPFNSPLFYYQTQASSVSFTLKRCESPAESSHLPAEQLSLNGSRRLLKPSFTPAATTSAGIKSYKSATNTDEIWLML